MITAKTFSGSGWIMPILRMIDSYKIKRVEVSGSVNTDIADQYKKKESK